MQNKFSERLKEILWTLEARKNVFAAILGVSAPYITQLTKGDREPSEQLVTSICRSFDMDQRWVRTGEGDMYGHLRTQTEKEAALAYARNFVKNFKGAVQGTYLEDQLEPPETHKDIGRKSVHEIDGFYMVPRFSTVGGMGNIGNADASEYVTDYLAFRKDWLVTGLGVKPEALAVISVSGDSMTPTVNDGDVVLVDTSQTTIMDGKVFTIQVGNGAFVKRLKYLADGRLVIVSDNPEEQNVPVEESMNLRVTGRVIWHGGRI